MLGKDLKRILVMYSPDYDVENTYPVFFTKYSERQLYFIAINPHGDIGLREYDFGGSLYGDNSPTIGDIIRVIDDNRVYRFYDVFEEHDRFYHIENLMPDKGGERSRVLVALMED